MPSDQTVEVIAATPCSGCAALRGQIDRLRKIERLAQTVADFGWSVFARVDYHNRRIAAMDELRSALTQREVMLTDDQGSKDLASVTSPAEPRVDPAGEFPWDILLNGGGALRR